MPQFRVVGIDLWGSDSDLLRCMDAYMAMCWWRSMYLMCGRIAVHFSVRFHCTIDVLQAFGRSLDDEDHNCLFTSVRYFHLPSSVVNKDSWLPKGVTCSHDTVNLLPKNKKIKAASTKEKKLASGAQCGGFHRDVLNKNTAEKQQEKWRKKNGNFILLLVVLS
ncbi:hypothetical protein CDAR_56381 [Caerostris darwini]|uniref:Uncharacterized protein n=1 Tax=Caerostris darwini TaxID=1538125 RepID=A0AAV4WKQ5_9ARAC|nr:hypothetical protein CDAR_56381 [Caerostris darwini]